MKTIFYETGKKNEKYWEKLKFIRENGKPISCEWNGDYLVSKYEFDDAFCYVWENMEYGIQHKIEIEDKE